MLNMRKDSGSVTQLGLFNDTGQDTEVIEKALSTFTPPDDCWFGEEEIYDLFGANILFDSANIDKAIDMITTNKVELGLSCGVKIDEQGIYHIINGYLYVMEFINGGLEKYMEECDKLGIKYELKVSPASETPYLGIE
jgi:hypothetical protein